MTAGLGHDFDAAFYTFSCAVTLHVGVKIAIAKYFLGAFDGLDHVFDTDAD